MGSTGGDHIKIPANNAAGCSETTVEIKIKTLDSRTFTLRVDKCVPVPELKEHIASVTGVVSEQQHLICRGKVLKDDQLLSAYHVEDGHTLHLVVRQPVAPSPELSDHPAAATDPTSSTGQNPGNRVGPGMVVGTFNISEQGDGTFPDLNRILSVVLNSFGVSRFGSGSEGIDLNIILDSLTTLLQYVSHLRQEFLANAGGQSANARNAGFSRSDGQESEAAVHASEPRGLLTPESLGVVVSSTRQLLAEQATECLLHLAGQLESHSSMTDPLERSRIQSNAIRSGALFHNLGALLLELGRAMMTLRMGQTSADALVNAGPPVFVSSTGPNPIMVQPLPFPPGASFGSVPVGTVQNGSGLAGGSAGTGFLPRNIDIRIRTGSIFPQSQREPTDSQQPQGPMSSNSVNSGQQDAAAPDPNSRGRDAQMRAIPIRTVVAAVPASAGRRSDSSRGSIGILYPVLARVQHVSSGNSNGTRASQALDQHHDPNGNTGQPIPDSAVQRQNVVVPENGNNSLPPGLEQLLSTIFPGAHIVSDNADAEPSGSGSVPSHTDVAQDIGTSPGSASAVSNEGLILSNILHQIMPMLSENPGPHPNMPPTEGASSDETQTDGNPNRGSSSRTRSGPPSQPSPKRRRRE
ncbi:Ubiquitin-like protein [Handroanthus impetiginosus]|uniref:Ubiquitin-like protein n=1 Tax=Handroanthus impetiginosus TaxID=429701 RepID=A0A2G9I2M5_9LAMI|nr:Ubiquitin-like protein [Handroanthus impetiginosus]